jgi:hypothetical protein
MQVRLIISATEEGRGEYIAFWQDFDLPEEGDHSAFHDELGLAVGRMRHGLDVVSSIRIVPVMERL